MSKLIYQLYNAFSVVINNQGNIRFKKGAALKKKAYGLPLAMILLMMLFALYLAAIILLMHNPSVKKVAFDDASIAMFWRCFLYDFFLFQIIKLLPQITLIASVHHRPQTKAVRDTIIFITERYVLRYYIIFYLQEIKSDLPAA